MFDEEFEWDDAKARANLIKHGVSFVTAIAAFFDERAVLGSDDSMDYGEPRYWIIGKAEAKLLFVIYTERLGRTRIISARLATRKDHGHYQSENQQR